MRKNADGQRIKKNKGMLEKEEIAQYDESGNVISVTYKYKNPIFSIFEDDLFAELYNARCHDTGESLDAEGARAFREEILKRNDQNTEVINLYSLRLGINSIVSLANSLICRKLTRLNLADNAISDYGMHAVKNILESTEIEFLNLSSNMISGDGLEHLVEVISTHSSLKVLNLGLYEGSMRKNSLSLSGAASLAAILLKNTSLDTLILEDNDISANGGECFGIALTQNCNLKHLKLAENDLRTEGASLIIKNASKLESLDLSKNYITADAGQILEKLLSTSRRLKKIVLEYNELLPAGAEFIAKGLRRNAILTHLNLKGNILGDDGVQFLVNVLQENKTIRELNLSLNEIGPMGSSAIAQILTQTKIKNLDISKNYLGDEALIVFAGILGTNDVPCKLKSLNVGSCRIGDRGVEIFITSIIENKHLNFLNLSDNFISEKLETLILECLDKNYFLCKVLLKGNRLSHSCISRVKRICDRNRKEHENAEPNRLKNEQYRLEYERRKLAQAEDLLHKQISEVDKVKEMREDIMTQIEVLRENEKSKREYERQKIQEEQAMIADKEARIKKARAELDAMKAKYQKIIEDMKSEYEEKVSKRDQIQREIELLEAENKDLENEMPEMIKELQEKINSTKKETASLEEETRLVREEMQKVEQELQALRAAQASQPAPDGQKEAKKTRKSTKKK
ncbi:hypothetical protein SteCoe_21177 [Stentor coeruleus]|uniref:Uncharacterized protein n=1 Tax=Stentor coeruleus TaxID=5963 RepID=A0A1R2BQ98_9CILI|nr:hypothetical protein SteCoe_21177 [Stentor coeruleus]